MSELSKVLHTGHPDTRVMTVAYAHTDPLLAAGITNAVLNGRGNPVRTEDRKVYERVGMARPVLLGSSSEVEHAEQALADYTRRPASDGLESKSTPTTEKLYKLPIGYASRNGSYFKRVLARTSAPGKDHSDSGAFATRRRRTCKKTRRACPLKPQNERHLRPQISPDG